MRWSLLLSLLVASPAFAAGEKSGTPSPTSDASNNRVTATGTPGSVPLKTWMARFVTTEALAVDVNGRLEDVEATRVYDLPFFFSGVPANSQKVAVVFPRTVTVPASCSGSKVLVGTNPTAQASVTLKQNGLSVGTVAIATDGTGTFTCASPITISSGDLFSVHAQDASDATLADIAITVAGMIPEATRVYDSHFYFTGIPSNAQKISVAAARSMTIPVGCTGSRVSVGVNPASQATVALKKNGSTVGTITVATNGTATFTCASPVSFAAADLFTVQHQDTADATMADIAITIVGSF
jgi:hypothetical protein